MPKFTNQLFKYGAVLLVALAGAATCVATSIPTPATLYKEENKRVMTQAQQWQLDFELANEYLQYGNNRRFLHLVDRWAWFDEIAKTYEIADLVRQAINTRPSSNNSYEPAFTRLMELGKSGNISARCFAWMIHGHLDKSKTQSWKYSYEDAARLALESKDSGHPICKGIEGSLYLYGKLGYPQDKEKAKPYIIESALQGFYGDLKYLSGANSQIEGRSSPKKMALELCWRRQADRQSEWASFEIMCSAYKNGRGMNANLQDYKLSDEVRATAIEWCQTTGPKADTTAQDCAELEKSYLKE
jgi:hypothetical protein